MSWELPMSPYCWLLPTYISRSDPSNYQKWIVDISQNSNQPTELYINGRKLEPSKLLNPSQPLCFIVEFLKFYSRNSQQVCLGVHRIWVLKNFYGMFMFSRRGEPVNALHYRFKNPKKSLALPGNHSLWDKNQHCIKQGGWKWRHLHICLLVLWRLGRWYSNTHTLKYVDCLDYHL